MSNESGHYSDLYLNEITDFWRLGRIPKASHWFPQSRTVKWLATDDLTAYNRFRDRPWMVYGPDSIDYTLNSFGYRSIEPDPSSPNKKVMFVGCSFTQGIGLPLQDVWTSVAVAKLKTALGIEIEQHNFGQAGHGADVFAQIIHQTLPVLKPDLLVVLFTEPSRRTLYKQFNHRQWYTVHDGGRPDDSAWSHYIALQNDPTDFYEWVRNFHLINYAAQANSVPWVWQTYVPSINETPRLDGYVRVDNRSPVPFPSIREYARKQDFARDGNHAGPVTNRLFGEALAEHILDQGLIRN